MKVGKKELYLLLALLGIGIAICAWQFGFKKINVKTEGLEAETELLQVEIRKYTAVKDNIDVYQKGIEDATNKIAETLRVFPSNVLIEDSIMLGREFEKDNEDTFMTAVTAGSASNIYIATSRPVDPSVVPISYGLYDSSAMMAFKTSYEGFKDMVKYLYEHDNRMSVQNFALTYDPENGQLIGSTGISMYYVSGTDKEYTPQNIHGVGLGTDNIFGTLK